MPQIEHVANDLPRGRVVGKGEGPWENWEKVQVLWICKVLRLSRAEFCGMNIGIRGRKMTAR